jgi:endoglucanase
VSWPKWSIADVMSARPAVRVNQLGCLPDRPMRATLISSAELPVPFTVRDIAGATMLVGESQPWPVRPEPSSGLSVHLLDFSGLAARGTGFRISAGDQRSHPFAVADGLYSSLCGNALRVLYLLRSGMPLADDITPGYGRPAGHVGRPPNRGDIEVPAWTGPDADRLYPDWRGEGSFNVSGGWYDAGDYGKYVTSGAIALWQLMSTLGWLRTIGRTELAAAMDDECRWQLDWLLRMQVPPGFQYAGMAFHRVHGTEWSPLPGWAHEDPTRRVLHRPSTTATLHLAAVAAQGARLFGPTDRSYANHLLRTAREAYEAAQRHPRLLAPDDNCRFGGGAYPDEDPTDDFYWAATELWLTTKEESYRAAVLSSTHHHRDVFDPGGFDFDRVAAVAALDLARSGQELPDYDRVREMLRAAADQLLDIQRRQPWGQPYAPDTGWVWGSNGRLLNNLVVLATAHTVEGDPDYANAVTVGMDYLLGRNALGQSYITGYGTDFTRHQRTRQFAHDRDPAFPPPPAGAICGGPNSRPSPDFPYDRRLIGLPPQCCYLDEPTSEVTNDICIRWNAPLITITTYLTATET